MPQRLLRRWQCFDDDGGEAHPRCQTGEGEHRCIGWHHHAGLLKGRRPRLKVTAVERIFGPCLNAQRLGQRTVPKGNTLAEGLHENGFREGRSGQTKGGGGLTRCGNVQRERLVGLPWALKEQGQTFHPDTPGSADAEAFQGTDHHVVVSSAERSITVNHDGHIKASAHGHQNAQSRS